MNGDQDKRVYIGPASIGEEEEKERKRQLTSFLLFGDAEEVCRYLYGDNPPPAWINHERPEWIIPEEVLLTARKFNRNEK